MKALSLTKYTVLVRLYLCIVEILMAHKYLSSYNDRTWHLMLSEVSG